jgi:hypothetical protein
MKKHWTWMAASLLLMAGSAVAQAATVTYPGKKAEKLKANQEVTGPAVVKSDDGRDVIEVRKDAVLRFLGTETDEKGAKAEMYFLKSGGLDADVGFYSRIATPSFWAFPEKAGARASFYAETFGVNTGYARAADGSGLVRLLSDRESMTEVQLKAAQGVTVERDPRSPGTIGFTTDADNEWRKGLVRVVYPLPTGLFIDVYVPKATSGAIRPKPDVSGKTEVENMVTSWKSGKMRIVTLLGDNPTGEGEIGPGVVATIDNASGKIEIGFVKVEFATLKAAVGLTSEFESLATSPIAKPKK